MPVISCVFAGGNERGYPRAFPRPGGATSDPKWRSTSSAPQRAAYPQRRGSVAGRLGCINPAAPRGQRPWVGEQQAGLAASTQLLYVGKGAGLVGPTQPT